MLSLRLTKASRERYTFDQARKMAEKELQTNGLKMVGGNTNRHTRRSTRVLLKKVTDDKIRAQLPKEWEAKGSFLSDLIQWIKDHKEQILKVLKIILTLVMLFMEDPAVIKEIADATDEMPVFKGVLHNLNE